MNRKRLLEMIDACRPGHADQDDPELQPLADAAASDEQIAAALERSQRTDDVIGQAVRDVKPPPGATDRLLAALENERPSRRSARRLASAAGIAIALGAVAAAVLAAVLLPAQPHQVDLASPVAIADAVDDWDEALDSTAWQDGATAPTDALPHYRNLPLPISSWQWAAPNRIACYELFGGRVHNVRLFVMRRPKLPFTLGTAPPLRSYPSLNWSTSAWESDGYVYVLAVSLYDQPSEDLYQTVTAVSLPPA